MFLFASAAAALGPHHSGASASAAASAGSAGGAGGAVEYIDVASLTQLSKFTGGQSYYYPGFTYSRAHSKLAAELSRNVLRSTGWESVVRIRPSAGLKLKAFYGNFYLRGADLLALPVIDSDKVRLHPLPWPWFVRLFVCVVLCGAVWCCVVLCGDVM